MSRRAHIIVILAAAAVAATAALRSQDSVEDVLRRGYELPLRWDNIEAAPEWVSGERPEYDRRRHRHEVALAPGESVCVRVPAYELLRVVRGEDVPLAPGELAIALSTGSGLLAFTEPTADATGASLLVDPQRPYPMLAHVMRPSQCGEAIRVSLFTSRHGPLNGVASYRDLIDFGSGDKVRLTTSVEADALAFWRWDRGSRATVRLRGAGRYLLQTRYRYPPDEQKLPQTYHIDVRDAASGAPIASVEYATSHETAHLVFADGEAQVVSRLEPGFFELDEDRNYEVTLDTSAPVFVRLLRMEDREYLAHALNAPRPRPGDVADDLRAPRFQQSPWEMPEAGLRDVLENPSAFPAEQVERAAMRLARDNRRREGGMMASALLWNAGAPRRDYPDIRERWREFTGFRTYYRDALPEGDCLAPLQRAYFTARTLQSTGAYREWLAFGDQHVSAGFSRLPLATFSQVQRGGSRSLFRLPGSATHSIVRIAAERERDRAADFWIKVPGEDARRFRLLPQPELPWGQTKPTQGEAALTLMEGTTLDAPAAQRREANELVPAGYFEFFVPPGVRQIELWDAAGSEHLPVAIQYRASDVFELSEDEYAAVVAMLGRRERVLPALVELLSGTGTSPEKQGETRARRELANHWEPLRRFVRSRYRQFVDSVAPQGSMPAEAARLEDADRLIAEGEYFLAERLARYLYIYADDGALRGAAFATLTAIAQRHLDPERLMLNACVAMAVEPGEANAAALCRLLRKNAEPELALMLALALPAGDESTRELRLACTFVKGWWAQFAAILQEEPGAPDCRVWRAHQLSRLGRYDAARSELELAGADGAPWLAHIDATLAVREKVAAGDAGAIRDWAELETTRPGEKVWAPISPQDVHAFRAGVTVRALEREKYFPAFIATAGSPLELQFATPRRLRVECRPLHAAGSGEPIEGWVSIEGGGRLLRRLPVIANYRSPGLEIVGRDGEQPGTLVWDEFGVDGWNTRLKIRPASGAIVVRVMGEEPEVRSGHLPPLNDETAAWLFRHSAPLRAEPDDELGFGTVAIVSPVHEVTTRSLAPPFADPTRAAMAEVHEQLARLAPVPQTMTRASHRDTLDQMTDWLWRREQPGIDPQTEAVAAGSAHLAAHLDVPELAPIHAKIVRQTVWEPLLAADESAGFREVETGGWQPENPDLLSRMRLLPRLGERAQLISGTDSLIAMLTNKAENTVRLGLKLEAVPYLVAKPLHASVQLGAQAAQLVTLTLDQAEKQFEFRLPAGQTSVRVEALESEPNHFLRVELDAENERELFERKTLRNYFVATASEPLSARIDGPAWVRVDRLDGGQTRSDYRFVRDAVETLKLAPELAGEQALYRIHVLRLDASKPFHPPAFTERAVEAVAPPLGNQPLAGRARLAEFDDEFHLGAQEDGTWSLGLSHNSRRAAEEDSVGSRGAERFWQADLTYRYYDEDLRTYFRTTLLGHLREFGEPASGIEHSLQHRPFDHPLTYTLGGSAFWQDGEWALNGLGSIGLTNELSPKWSHTSSLTAFFRELSLDAAGEFPERVDQDLFTQFKSDHRRGLRLREEIAYAPWRDTRITAGAGIGTIEDFNPLEPDSFTYSVGVSQLLGPVQLGADLRGYRFFADDDRSATTWRHRLSLEASGEFWRSNQQRIEAGVSLTHFIEEDEDALFLFARWHFGEGRMLRDFRPGERLFSSSREPRIPQDRNNAIRQLDGRQFRSGK